MAYIVDRKSLHQLIDSLLFEKVGQKIGHRAIAPGRDTGYNIRRTKDVPLVSKEQHQEDISAPFEIPNPLPIMPTEMMATQLATQRPPVEDDNYIPENVIELGNALNVLAQAIPDPLIEKYYTRIRNSIMKLNDAYFEEEIEIEVDE